MKFEILLRQFRIQLKEIKSQNIDIVKQSNISIATCRNILSKMNKEVVTSSFANDADEINFFKNIKTEPLSQLIYYSELRSFEILYPKASFCEQKEYLEKKIKKVNNFFNYNIEFVQYVRQEKTYLDTSYYTRANYDSFNITDTKSYYRAPEFSTSHDILLGKVIGFDLLINYLKKRLDKLQNPEILNLHNKPYKSEFQWTSSKVALTELIYALHSSGAINNGTAGIKELANLAEKYFNIELGDFYRAYLEIRNRKIERAKFLEKMKTSLITRMEQAEE
jgi:RteC protein